MRKTKLIVMLVLIISLSMSFGMLVACDSHTHKYELEKAEEAYIATEATCTQKATYYKSCECGAKGTETFEYGDFAEHIKPENLSYNQTHHWYICTNEHCGAKIDESEHNFENGITCIICEYSKPFTQGLEYELNDDGQSYYVKGKGTATDTEIVIPSTYEGKPVTSIGNNAFRNCGNITSIALPDSVESIGECAFFICTNLESINIPNSVTSIGYYAFENCYNLTGVYITDIEAWCKISFDNNPLSYAKNLYLNNQLVTKLIIPNSVESIGSCAFFNCSSLTNVTIPSSVTSIGSGAFYGCSSLTRVYIMDIEAWCKISFGDRLANPLYYANNLYLNNQLVTELIMPNSVTSIGDYAFDGCSSLTSIEIPSGVTSIGQQAFNLCSNLTNIEIPDSVTSIGKSAFYKCSSLTSITIPDGVTSIESSAFWGCSSLTGIEIPNSVTSIGGGAFWGCSSLTSIDIPNSVTSIGDYAFNGCSSLTNVYYKGSAEDWGEVIIERGNTILTSATIYYYSETEPALNEDQTAYDGNYWHYDTNGNIVEWKKEN